MPVLSVGGEKANGAVLAHQIPLVATDAKSVVLPNTGHWVIEENPQATMDALVSFLNPSASARASTGTASEELGFEIWDLLTWSAFWPDAPA
jgi:hypothetical protein